MWSIVRLKSRNLKKIILDWISIMYYSDVVKCSVAAFVTNSLNDNHFQISKSNVMRFSKQGSTYF